MLVFPFLSPSRLLVLGFQDKSQMVRHPLHILGKKPWTVVEYSLMAHIIAETERAEHFLARPANGAFPVIGKVFKTCSFWNLSLAVASLRIIDISTGCRLALPHFLSP